MSGQKKKTKFIFVKANAQVNKQKIKIFFRGEATVLKYTKT